MSGGGSSGSNTTTQVQQIPEYEQQFSQSNQDLAQSLASQPYPQYQGQLIAPLNQVQQQGQQQAFDASTNWIPSFYQGQDTTNNALNASNFNNQTGAANQALSGVGAQIGVANQALSGATPTLSRSLGATGAANGNITSAAQQLQGTVSGAEANQSRAAATAQAMTNPNAVSQYMNPFVQQALAPQIQQLQLQLAGQQQGINSQAAGANAYGDARQGAAQGLQNLYGNQALNQLIGTGYNNAYTQALAALGQGQQTQLGAASQYGNIAQSGLGQAAQYGNLANTDVAMGQNYNNVANTQLQQGVDFGNLANTQVNQGNAYANLGQLANQQQQIQLAGGAQQLAAANQAQQQTLTGANAVYNAGTQQQTAEQQGLNASYQQYLNQVNWPYQQLNVRESALSNSPYNIQTATTLPNANSTAQGFGTLASAAGLLGSLGSGSSSGTAPFGGQALQ